MTVQELIEQLGHCNPAAVVSARDEWDEGEFKVTAMLFDDKTVCLLPSDD